MHPWVKFGRDFTDGLLAWVYPPICWVCEHARPLASSGLCVECVLQLTHEEHATCPRCSSTVGPHVMLEGGCTRCRDESYHFDGAFRMGPYDGLLRDVVLRLKARNGEALAEVIGSVFATALRPRLEPFAFDAVLPVPLHWSRRWWRGFNQSEVLARSMAHALGAPLRHAWLRRTRRTPPQKAQPPSRKLANVRGAFTSHAPASLEGRTLLLVDDVLTTGSTLSEAARALRPSNPKAIYVAVLAHGS